MKKQLSYLYKKIESLFFIFYGYRIKMIYISIFLFLVISIIFYIKYYIILLFFSLAPLEIHARAILYYILYIILYIILDIIYNIISNIILYYNITLYIIPYLIYIRDAYSILIFLSIHY
jgi:hypothetical protein